MKRVLVLVAVACVTVLWTSGAVASTPGADVALTNDCVLPSTPDVGPGYVPPPRVCEPPGYVSAYTLAGLGPYTDATLDECSIAHGRQNEPAVEVDPRNASVLIGSSNDYCGVYNTVDSDGTPLPIGPIWLGYYRSEDGGASFLSSLVPGYPDDTSPFAALAHVRTASSGDPVIAWDAEGRVFLGSESSDDPAGTLKTFGDVWVARYVNPHGVVPDASPLTADDGKLYAGTEVVARGSSAPNLLGVFHDKTAINADHNYDGRCSNFVYFSWSRFTGNGNNAIYFSRSTNHGVSFTQPMKISTGVHDSQFADIAVTGNSNVYIAWREFASRSGQPDAIVYVKSSDCGQTFSRPRILQTFIPYDAQDIADPESVPTPSLIKDDPRFGEEAEEAGTARDCGDFDAHCQSGYTFFRRDTQVRMTADQFDALNPDRLYLVYDPTKDGTEGIPTGTTYGSTEPGFGSQSAIYFLRVDGASGTKEVGPSLIDDEAVGHQWFPDIAADNRAATTRGTLHVIWWDSRNDGACYSPTRPVGNCADKTTVAGTDAWSALSTDYGTTWPTKARLSDVSSNPNYEQFANRTVPFAGDYLWATSTSDATGAFAFGVWTDWRDTRQGPDPREVAEDEDNFTADVYQCRTVLTIPPSKPRGEPTNTWSGDLCPHSGGLDQNIYGDHMP